LCFQPCARGWLGRHAPQKCPAQKPFCVRDFPDFLRELAHLRPLALPLIAVSMPHAPTYFAAVCMSCRRASLFMQAADGDSACPRCGATSLRVPGAHYSPSDVALFTELEAVVHAAQLSRRGAAFIAAELETVGLRWEPPELALERVARRLPGLHRVYSPRQDYGHLLLAVSMLLTIVCARLQSPAQPRSLAHNESGLHPKFQGDLLSGPQQVKKIG